MSQIVGVEFFSNVQFSFVARFLGRDQVPSQTSNPLQCVLRPNEGLPSETPTASPLSLSPQPPAGPSHWRCSHHLVEPHPLLASSGNAASSS